MVSQLCKSNKGLKRPFPVTNNVPQFPYADRPAERGLMLFFTFVRVVINYKRSRFEVEGIRTAVGANYGQRG